MEKHKFLEGYENFGEDVLTITKDINPNLQEMLNKYQDLNYIGTGNPDAEILFIGKEMSIPDSNSEQYKESVEQNVTKWGEEDFKTISNCNYKPYSPWYPYYRQLNKIGNNGTSRTEYFYQKVIEHIYEIPDEEKQYLTLHKYAFLSELSTATAATSNQVKKEDRQASIMNRKPLWKTPFFRSFPITILGIGPNKNYIHPGSDNKYIINIEKDFNVKWLDPTKYIGKKFINVHFSEDGKRMLLHTSHLSASSNELIEVIGKLCKIFLDGRADNTGMENVKIYLKSI